MFHVGVDRDRPGGEGIQIDVELADAAAFREDNRSRVWPKSGPAASEQIADAADVAGHARRGGGFIAGAVLHTSFGVVSPTQGGHG
jgi:hypothetical protein